MIGAALSRIDGAETIPAPLALDFEAVQPLSRPFAHHSGLAWTARDIRIGPGDGPDALEQSRLVLLEDGHPLGRPHASVSMVRDVGRGRYSHWMDQLIFSTSDNSDPNSNHRTYALGRLRGRIRSSRGFGLFADTLVAVYDLSCEMTSGDFLWVMALADLERRTLGLERGHVVFVPDWGGGSRDENLAYAQAHPPQARFQRLNDLLRPAVALFPGWGGVSILSGRDEAAPLLGRVRHLFPADYHPLLPRMLYPEARRRVLDATAQGREARAVTAPAASLATLRPWLEATAGGRHIITITLRRQPYHPERNSDLAAWDAFAATLPADRFLVIALPDPESPGTGLANAVGAPAIAASLPLRTALYQSSTLNLGVRTGPMTLCRLNRDCRYVVFGDEPHVDGPARLVVAEPDRPDAIQDAFAAAMAQLAPMEGPPS